MIRYGLPRRWGVALFAAGVVLLAGGLADAAASSARISSRASGLGSKTPAQIVAAAQAALRSARGYVMSGNLTQGKQKLSIKLSYGGAGKLEMTLGRGGGTAAVIVLPGGAYIKANKAYWDANGGRAAAKYANRWIELPASDGASFTKQLGQFNPNTLATCLNEDHGSLSLDGTTTVNGTRAVVIRDAGGVPGGGPGTLDVAATGPAYPLRATMTGPTLKGGKVDACNDGKGSDIEGTLTLGHFNSPPAITAPSHPIRLQTT